jgi:hypothetical protein
MGEEFDMEEFMNSQPAERIAPGVEVAIEMLQAAQQMFQLFVALMRAGFNEPQALFVIAEAMKSGKTE